jgi:hypothetical protein
VEQSTQQWLEKQPKQKLTESFPASSPILEGKPPKMVLIFKTEQVLSTADWVGVAWCPDDLQKAYPSFGSEKTEFGYGVGKGENTGLE